MKRTRLPAAAVLAAALLLSGACGAKDDEGGTASSPKPTEPNAGLIVYSDDPAADAGVTIEKVADVNKLKGAPDDFKQFIAGLISSSTSMLLDKKCPFSVGVAKIDTSAGFARGSMYSCGGADFIWAKRDGLWQEVLGSQDTPPCDDLKKYSVPKAIAGDKCYDGKKDVDYTG